MTVVIAQIFISPGHNFFGRHGMLAGEHPTREVSSARCRAGRGIEGDRFFGYRPDYKGQVTFLAAETVEGLKRACGVPALSAAVLRRNVVVRGIDLETLVGRRFLLGEVEFEGTGEARPCHWMDQAVGPGAEEWLKGRGGLRARVLTDGELRVGETGLVLREERLQPNAATGFVGKSAVELGFEGGI